MQLPYAGGPSGLSGITLPIYSAVNMNTTTNIFYLCVFSLIVIAFAVHGLFSSPYSGVLDSIRENELQVEAVGLDNRLVKTQLFALSGAGAGLSGALYVYYLSYVNPGPFNEHSSIMLLLMVVIGGYSSVWGPIAGSILVRSLDELIRGLGGLILGVSSLGVFYTAIFGLILALTFMYIPNGLVELLSSKLRQFSKSKGLGRRGEFNHV